MSIEQDYNNKENSISISSTINNDAQEKYTLAKQYDDLFKLVII